MSFYAGHYTATYGTTPTSIGSTESGFSIDSIQHFQPVIGDEGGDVPLDLITRGCQYVLRGLSIDYDLIRAVLYALQGATSAAFLTAEGNSFTNLGSPAANPVSGTALASSLILTAVNANIKPAILTAPLAIVAGDLTTNYSSSLRVVPVTFYLLPNRTTGVSYTAST